MTIHSAPFTELKHDGRVFTISVETFDPDRSRTILDYHNNGKQRKLKENLVRRYAQDMQFGLWTLTGETIVFDNEGNLLNGQHRFRASVKYGTTFTTFVISGADPAVIRDMDQGGKRTAADDAGMNGEANATTFTALASSELIFRNSTAGYGVRNAGQWAVSKSAIMAYLDSHPDRAELIREAAAFYHRGIAPNPYVFRTTVMFGLIYLHMLDAGVPVESAQEFFTQLRTGENLRHGSPVKSLRERLIQAKSDHEHITGLQTAHMLITAWNAYRMGEDRTQVKVYAHDFLTRLKDFPKIIGGEPQTAE
jgi:hypothetical protein